jgi:hypothetical protein
VGDEGFKRAPIGAGPYKFVSFNPGVELVLEANATNTGADTERQDPRPHGWPCSSAEKRTVWCLFRLPPSVGSTPDLLGQDSAEREGDSGLMLKAVSAPVTEWL